MTARTYPRRRAVALAATAALLAALGRPQPALAQDAPDFWPLYREAVGRFAAAADFSAPYIVTSAPGREAAAALDQPMPPYGLGELIEIAVRRNLGLAAAAAGVDAALADVKVAKARAYPSLSTQNSASFIGNPLGPVSVTADQFGPGVPPQDVLLYKGMESTRYDFKLIAELPLITWGKLSRGVALAEQALAAAGLQAEKARHELRLRVRASFESLAYLAEALRILEVQAAAAERLVAIAVSSREAGFITQSELLAARIKARELDLARARLEERRDALLDGLARDAGLDELGLGQLRLEPAPAGSAPFSDEADAARAALAGAYDLALAAAFAGVQDGLASLAEIQAKGRPDIGLRAELSYGGPRFPFLETDWFRQDDYQFTLSLGSSGGLLRSPLAAGQAAKAHAEALAAEGRLEEARGRIKSFIKTSYLGAALSRAKIEYALLRQEAWAAELEQKRTLMRLGAGQEGDYLAALIEALAGVAEAYGVMGEYRGALLGIEGAAGFAMPPSP